MQPDFIWKNIDSRTMGIWVSELPAPTRAAERTHQVEIPGRAGTLTLREGDNVHVGYLKDTRITVAADADFAAILDWLTGDGEVIFSAEPDRAYRAHLGAEVKFTREGNSLKSATIPFFVHPHKAQHPPEADITLEASGALYNPGTVASKPVITLTFTSACTLTMGGVTMTFTHPLAQNETAAEETITVDCDAELVTDASGIWDGKVYGDFIRIPPGSSAYAFAVSFSAFDSTAQYHTNDLCTYSSVICRAKTDNIGAWDADDWEQIAAVSGTPTGEAALKPRWRWF